MERKHMPPEGQEVLVARVRERYGRIAEGRESGCCGSTTAPCGSTSTASISERLGYAAEDLARAPSESDLGLGCGAPIRHLELRTGETVLDLGSGGGLDACLAAERVGNTGRVIGVDMTDEMLSRARQAAERAGWRQVEFRRGRLEALPIDDDSIDAVTSNCVINLVPDKALVFREIARVLRPGGRLVVSDIVLDGRLPTTLERDLLAWVGCIAGAMQRTEYFETLAAAGLRDVEVLIDRDFLASFGDALPTELETLAERSGVRPEELGGKVRSVTYRAVKPSSGAAPRS